MAWEKHLNEPLYQSSFDYSFDGEVLTSLKRGDSDLVVRYYKPKTLIQPNDDGCIRYSELELFDFTTASLSKVFGALNLPNNKHKELMNDLEKLLRLGEDEEERWKEPELLGGRLLIYDESYCYVDDDRVFRFFTLDTDETLRFIKSLPIVKEGDYPTIHDLFPYTRYLKFNVFSLNYTEKNRFLAEYTKHYIELENFILDSELNEKF